MIRWRASSRAGSSGGNLTRWRPRDRLTCSVGGAALPERTGRAFRVVLAVRRRATMRRPSANAPKRAGVAQ